MLKWIKQATLGTLKNCGVFKVADTSRWRRNRLLILAYHGISLADEHLWDSTQFMSPLVFRERMELLKKSGCTVLPLNEALERLYVGDLPEKSVAITFDDGTVDFQQRAFPVLQEFGFPVTLYLTTFYSRYNKPVFDVVCSYLLWKGRNATLDLTALTGEKSRIDLSGEAARLTALREIHRSASERKLSAEEKDALAATLATQLDVNYDELLARRILHLLTPDEVAALAKNGVAVELHTHRHRVPLDRELFRREIDDNRNHIRAMTGQTATHFCYPSGVYNSAFLPWLNEAGIKSATTCEPGLASPDSNPLLLPRLLDVSSLSPLELTGWLSGVSSALPRRREALAMPGY